MEAKRFDQPDQILKLTIRQVAIPMLMQRVSYHIKIVKKVLRTGIGMLLFSVYISLQTLLDEFQIAPQPVIE